MVRGYALYNNAINVNEKILYFNNENYIII